LLSKNIQIKTYETLILLAALYARETWLFTINKKKQTGGCSRGKFLSTTHRYIRKYDTSRVQNFSELFQALCGGHKQLSFDIK
jgi:hypothetical protein